MKKQRNHNKPRTLKTKKKHKKSKKNKWWHDEDKKNNIKLILGLMLVLGYFCIYRPLLKQYYWISLTLKRSASSTKQKNTTSHPLK